MRRLISALAFALGLSAGPAHAAPCILPYIIPNGVIPDASQVMANFYALLNCFNAGGAGAALTIPLDKGLTTIAGIDNQTPLNSGDTLRMQDYPINYIVAHTVQPSELEHLLTSSGASPVPWTLPQAGTAAYEKGRSVWFLSTGSGGASITPAGTSNLIGIPTSGGIASLPQYSFARATSDGANWQVLSGSLSGTGGTVTSVAETVPAEFTITGSPITTAGTLAIGKATETANTVWAGPTSGGAAQPAFRTLVVADLPGCTNTGNYGCLNLNNLWVAHQQPVPVALTDAATVTPTGTDANLYTLTLSIPTTTLACPGTINYGTYNFRFKQDGTGSRAITTASCYKYPGGTTPTWSTAANAVDVLSCTAFDTSRLECNALTNLQ